MFVYHMPYCYPHLPRLLCEQQGDYSKEPTYCVHLTYDVLMIGYGLQE